MWANNISEFIIVSDKRTNKKIAGGAYQLSTSLAVSAKATIQRLRRLREESKVAAE